MIQDSLCIDMSTHMNYVHVNVENKIVRVGEFTAKQYNNMIQFGIFYDTLTVRLIYSSARPLVSALLGGGARIGEVDAACAPHHFIVPVGRAHTTGMAGQVLSTGAHGYNERMHGLGIDHMTSATVVVARNGQPEVVRCSVDEEAELFWAVRGGGPKFCIVCEMTVCDHNHTACLFALAELC